PAVQGPLTDIAHLAHDLDRVLFNPGVHFLQDPRSKVYNFDPYLKNILSPSEFDFDALQPYITSSKDENLRQLAIKHGKKYVGSTSSTSHLLSHMYFLTTAFKPINASVLSASFWNEPRGYTRSMKLPASVCLRLKDGVYAIDADKSFDVTDGVLVVLGKSMEKMLTLPPEEFRNFHKDNSWKIKDLRNTPEPYHYAKVEDFLLRAQLDCQDPRLPRKTFDLKTRAAMPIRLDKYNYLNNSIYEIKKRYGLFESFEREYFDMIRSAFLKYSIQVRIGNMDGVFVCYHNTARVFGFQYISLDEMETRLFGNPVMGEQVFSQSIKLLGRILNTATERYPNQVSIHTQLPSILLTLSFSLPLSELAGDCRHQGDLPNDGCVRRGNERGARLLPQRRGDRQILARLQGGRQRPGIQMADQQLLQGE
ncbi:Pet127-domain-containing protein, partial [Basidiobolus meristosporus CBS 931.73]